MRFKGGHGQDNLISNHIKTQHVVQEVLLFVDWRDTHVLSFQFDQSNPTEEANFARSPCGNQKIERNV